LFPNLGVLACSLETGSGIQQVNLYDGPVRPGRPPSAKGLEAAVTKYANATYGNMWTVWAMKYEFKEECISVHDLLHVFPEGESPIEKYRARLAAEKGSAS
jgi:hypothetical protein